MTSLGLEDNETKRVGGRGLDDDVERELGEKKLARKTREMLCTLKWRNLTKKSSETCCYRIQCKRADRATVLSLAPWIDVDSR